MEDFENVIEKIKRIKARRVFVQFPEGLRLRIQDIVKKLEESGIEVVLCVEKCFGACDVRESEAELFGCDAVLHIGHEKFLPRTKIPVIYWEYFIDADPVPVLEKEFEKLRGFERIGLVTSIQFVRLVPAVKDFLEKKGKGVFVHKSLQHPGQVLGCNLAAAKAVEKKVDCFLAISAGEFYAAGLALQTDRPVLNLDLEKREIASLAEFRRKNLKIIAWNNAQFLEARRVGLLVSWKKGQSFRSPFELKKRLEKAGKEVYVLAMDEVTPEKIEGLKLDMLLNCACPRIGIDDQARYQVPVLNCDQLGKLKF